MKQFIVEQREQLDNANQCDIINKLFEDISSYEVLLFHQNIARTQRDAYNSQRTSVEELRNKLLIEVDFKQKITIGFGPRQLNTEYYDKRQKTRTCLGLWFMVYVFYKYCYTL
jgi:aminopeptidase C